MSSARSSTFLSSSWASCNRYHKRCVFGRRALAGGRGRPLARALLASFFVRFLLRRLDVVKTARDDPKVANFVACAVFCELFRPLACAFARPATRVNFFWPRREASKWTKIAQNRGLRSVFARLSALCARPLARALEGGFHVAENRKIRGLHSGFAPFAAFCARLRAAGHWREL